MAVAAPSLPQTAPDRFAPADLFRWWHLLSLDAPTVAGLWAWCLTRAAGVRFDAPSTLLLVLGAWTLYVSDRILDGLHKSGAQLRYRHFFYARYRGRFLAVGLPVALLLLWLFAKEMRPAARAEDSVLILVTATYFATIHLCGKNVERWLPKELAVGIIFAAATAVPAWSRLHRPAPSLIGSTAVFGALCWLNCVAIEAWERPAGELFLLRTGHATTRWAHDTFPSLCYQIAGLSMLLASFALRSHHSAAPPLSCCAAAIALWALDRHRDRFTPQQLRIAADLALLTPALFAFLA